MPRRTIGIIQSTDRYVVAMAGPRLAVELDHGKHVRGSASRSNEPQPMVHAES